MKYLIIYHKEDNDGLFSMAIIYNYLKHELKENAIDIDLFGTEYNELNKVEIDTLVNHYENIIMTDISFNDYKKMIDLRDRYGSHFIWIDHHAPVINSSIKYKFDNISGWRDIHRSAILNAYRYLYDQLDEKYQTKTCPEILRILSAWDSFSYEREGYTLDYVRNVNVGANIKYDLGTTTIINLVYDIIYTDTDYDIKALNARLHDLGKIINDAKDKEYESIINCVGDISWKISGRKACALFLQGPTNSLIFKSIATKIKNGIIFKRNNDGRWTISVYNTSTDYDKEFHCGNYLKEHYNGGGHAGAAGCQISEQQFIELLKTKSL